MVELKLLLKVLVKEDLNSRIKHFEFRINYKSHMSEDKKDKTEEKDTPSTPKDAKEIKKETTDVKDTNKGAAKTVAKSVFGAKKKFKRISRKEMTKETNSNKEY